MRRSTVLGLIAFCAFFVMAVSAGGPASTAGKAIPSTLTHPRVSDAELESKIHTKLAKSKIGKDGFSFHCKGGVVTWEGTTNVIQHKGAATAWRELPVRSKS